MKIFLTGHNGYIGSIMTPVLLNAGHEVVGIDSFYFGDCDLLPAQYTVKEIKKDIRDLTLEDLQGFDAVIHLAALSNDPLGDLKKELTYDINFHASEHLAKIAKEAGVRRFLYSSSCSMYGSSGGSGLVNEQSPLQPLTPYAESKVKSEESIARLADANFSPVFMRNATAYGYSPRLRADIVLNNFVCWGHTTGAIKILSDGTPWRPIVHAEDISYAFLAMLEAPIELVHNQAFNIGSHTENYQVKDLAEIVRQVIPGCKVEYAGDHTPDPRSYRVDFNKFETSLPDFKFRWNAMTGAQYLYERIKEANLTLEQFQGRKYIRLKQIRHLLDTEKLDRDLRWKN